MFGAGVGLSGFLLFSSVVLQPNEITNLISITTDFMRSESQACILHFAIPLLPLIGTIRLSRAGKMIIQEAVQNPFPVSMLDCSRTWRAGLKTGVLKYSGIAKRDITVCMNSILNYDPIVLLVLPKMKLYLVNKAGKWDSQTQRYLY